MKSENCVVAVVGLPEVDISDWMKHTDVKYQEGLYPNKKAKKIVEWFWQIVESFSQEQRARLLQFTTGTSRVPVEGFRVCFT